TRTRLTLTNGNDVTIANGLAVRYCTGRGSVKGLWSAIRKHLSTTPLCTPLTVAHGPMTRVSDRVAFAGAVAAEGGLPFLALALMSGPEVAILVEEAAEQLAGQQWGVGILGFVPPELREVQLEAVRAVRPPFALIAGGRHDERSAAMVAAVAAPLAERGATVGVLMGTAYLFTREAVEAGAVLEGFQSAAVSCDRTVLLETSPGHVTRCADTPYVAAFNAARQRLADAGASSQEMWSELEELNLGRLRIASKGLRREEGRLVEVTEDEQHEAG